MHGHGKIGSTQSLFEPIHPLIPNDLIHLSGQLLRYRSGGYVQHSYFQEPRREAQSHQIARGDDLARFGWPTMHENRPGLARNLGLVAAACETEAVECDIQPHAFLRHIKMLT